MDGHHYRYVLHSLYPGVTHAEASLTDKSLGLLKCIVKEDMKGCYITTKESPGPYGCCKSQFFNMSLCFSQLLWYICAEFFCHHTAVWLGDWHSKSSPPVRRCQHFNVPEYFSAPAAANYQNRLTEIKVYLKSKGCSLRKKAEKFIFMIPQSVCGRCPSLTVMVFGSFKKRSLRHRLGSSPDSGTNTSLMGTNIPVGIRH